MLLVVRDGTGTDTVTDTAGPLAGPVEAKGGTERGTTGQAISNINTDDDKYSMNSVHLYQQSSEARSTGVQDQVSSRIGNEKTQRRNSQLFICTQHNCQDYV